MFQNLFTSTTLERLAESIILLATSWVVNHALQRLIHIPRQLETRRAKTITTVFKSLISAFVYTTALYFVFKTLGIDVTPIVASAGIAGLAIGFGARSVVEDLLSGVFLLLEDSIAVGDLIRTGKSEGVVKNISFRTITLQDKDGALHIIPNGKVGTVINLSRAKARINIDLTVSTEQKIDALLKLVDKTLAEIQKGPELGKKISDSKVKGIEEFVPGGKMLIKIVIYTHWRHQWKVSRRFRYLLKKNLEQADIALA